MKIVLLGYMGSGKSTIGKCLATHLCIPYVDLDYFIETNEGMSISDLFEQKGVLYFRSIEAKYLKVLIAKNGNTVIALGGGTPVYGDNMSFLKNTPGVSTIYLKWPIEVLTRRLWITKNKRPLISGISSIEELEDFIRKHLFERSFVYHQADRVISPSDSPPMAAALLIAQDLDLDLD